MHIDDYYFELHFCQFFWLINGSEREDDRGRGRVLSAALRQVSSLYFTWLPSLGVELKSFILSLPTFFSLSFHALLCFHIIIHTNMTILESNTCKSCAGGSL